MITKKVHCLKVGVLPKEELERRTQLLFVVTRTIQPSYFWYDIDVPAFSFTFFFLFFPFLLEKKVFELFLPKSQCPSKRRISTPYTPILLLV